MHPGRPRVGGRFSMTLPSSFVSPARTLFGRGSIEQLLGACAEFGARGLLVHGRSLASGGNLDRIRATAPAGIDLTPWECPAGEPTLDQLDDLLAAARGAGVDWVVGIGGGSTMDLAKACAGLIHLSGEVVAYHDGAAIDRAGVPFAAAPTTAGSGSEATMVSVLTNTSTGIKKSFRHPFMTARLIVLDPDLLAAAPPHVIAHSGIDAFTQAVESYVSRNAVWFSESLSLRAIELVNRSIEAVYADSTCAAADDIVAGSHLAGLGLSYARLGAVHGLAHPLGERFHAAHGLVCGVCLPAVLRFNRDSIENKYRIMSDTVGGDLLQRTEQLLDALNVVSPFRGRPVPDDPAIIKEALASGSTAANPRDVNADDAARLLHDIFRS